MIEEPTPDTFSLYCSSSQLIDLKDDEYSSWRLTELLSKIELKAVLAYLDNIFQTGNIYPSKWLASALIYSFLNHMEDGFDFISIIEAITE
jgi:hypothetical protein